MKNALKVHLCTGRSSHGSPRCAATRRASLARCLIAAALIWAALAGHDRKPGIRNDNRPRQAGAGGYAAQQCRLSEPDGLRGGGIRTAPNRAWW